MENVYELLYMIRMKNEWAMNRLCAHMNEMVVIEVNHLIKEYAPLVRYRDDMIQEGQIVVARAIETYRNDRFCSFYTYVTLAVRRRLWQVIHTLNTQAEFGFSGTVEYEEDSDMMMAATNLAASPQMLWRPEYHLAYNEAYHRLEQMVQTLSEDEKRVLDTWIEGGTYTMNCEKLGLTYKQYDGRLNRLKKKVRKTVYQRSK
ncbi:MAG: sigma-70 family RNA polymerase sigma factor [Solobacterium sp.]|nr:sigma-70 family RNA polymerase sigma factor [Solobacterium sp.]